MIIYDRRKWGLWSICMLNGSIFPPAFCVATPCALMALALGYLFKEDGMPREKVATEIEANVVGGYTFVLGFLITFRAQRAYDRWWEGGTLLQQLRGEWFNAFSSLLAFCTSDQTKREQVEKFEHQLMRLMSVLYCSALQQVSRGQAAIDFELIDLDGFDQESLEFLESCSDRVEVVLQWIQRLIVENIWNGTLPIAPPILSRVFQEYSRGIVNLNNARKIAEFPFPFPMVQLVNFMMVLHLLIIPPVAVTTLESPVWASIVTFVVIFLMWSLHYLAEQLEMPYGSDQNDLPLQDMQSDMNRSLRTLLHEKAKMPPPFKYSAEVHKQARSMVVNVQRPFSQSRKSEMQICKVDSSGSLGSSSGRKPAGMTLSDPLAGLVDGIESKGNQGPHCLAGHGPVASPSYVAGQEHPATPSTGSQLMHSNREEPDKRIRRPKEEPGKPGAFGHIIPAAPQADTLPAEGDGGKSEKEFGSELENGLPASVTQDRQDADRESTGPAVDTIQMHHSRHVKLALRPPEI